jgi:hypothetical protein
LNPALKRLGSRARAIDVYELNHRLSAAMFPVMMNADFMAFAMMVIGRGGRRRDGYQRDSRSSERKNQGFHMFVEDWSGGARRFGSVTV